MSTVFFVVIFCFFILYMLFFEFRINDLLAICDEELTTNYHLYVSV